jgi:hypothetical protein
MALADLMALAGRLAPPEPVTPVTRDPLPTGYGAEAQKAAETASFKNQ